MHTMLTLSLNSFSLRINIYILHHLLQFLFLSLLTVTSGGEYGEYASGQQRAYHQRPQSRPHSQEHHNQPPPHHHHHQQL